MPFLTRANEAAGIGKMLSGKIAKDEAKPVPVKLAHYGLRMPYTPSAPNSKPILSSKATSVVQRAVVSEVSKRGGASWVGRLFSL